MKLKDETVLKGIIKDLVDNNNSHLNDYTQINIEDLAKDNFALLKELCKILGYDDMY